MPVQLDDVATVVGLSLKAAMVPHQAEVQTLRRDLATVAAELEALRAREPIAGPPGPVGATGADGKDGKDGKDGEPGPPGPAGKVSDTFKSRYMPGTTYVLSDLVKEDGSTWICKATTTTERPGKSSAWEIFSMRGDRGRDAKDTK
jgi:hypothetical protein